MKGAEHTMGKGQPFPSTPLGKRGRKFRLTLRQQDAVIGWLLVLPSLVLILGITLQPILTTLYLSLFETAKVVNAPRTFIGLGNYTALLGDTTFWQTIQRTIYFMAVSVTLEVILGIAIAQLINSRPWGWRFLRLSLIIPWAIPTIVNGAMWKWIYNADFGALNGLLLQLGFIERYQAWLTNAFRAMNFIIIADVWHTVPFVALVMQAAMAALPVELDEAAAVDGATMWQRFLRVRLPLLRPAILVVLVIRSVEAFRVFDIVYTITQGAPAYGTVTISYQAYLETFSFGHPGRGAALSFLISVFTLIMAFIYIRFLYRPEEKA